MVLFHFSNYKTIDEAMIGFVLYCREHNLQVGINHTEEALKAASDGFANDKDTLKYALKALFCTMEEQHDAFDRCFETFWGKRKHEYAHTIKNKAQSNVTKKANASLVMMGFNPKGLEKEQEEEDAKNVSGASSIESLKKTDFTKLAHIDQDLLDELTEQLLRELNHKLKRKMEATKRGGIDIRRTIRKNLSYGDVMINLERRDRKQEKYRLILLLDVSGSMDKYSFFLLKFLWSLKSNLKHIEAFVFSTSLIRITDFLHTNQLDQTLWEMSHYANNWSSGTRIGASLKEFNDRFAKRMLNGKSITIIMSDGLDQGDAVEMKEQMERIKLRTSKLVWLNPLKAMKGYEPTAKGMAAALPYLDTFSSAHNFESLLELENILSHA